MGLTVRNSPLKPATISGLSCGFRVRIVASLDGMLGGSAFLEGFPDAAKDTLKTGVLSRILLDGIGQADDMKTPEYKGFYNVVGLVKTGRWCR